VHESDFYSGPNRTRPQGHTAYIQLSPILDDINRFYMMKVRTGSLGGFDFHNHTKRVQIRQTGQILGYDHERHALTFTFRDYAQALAFDSSIHVLFFNLTDDVSKFRTYSPTLTIEIVPARAALPTVTTFDHQLRASIQKVDALGSLVIGFNKEMRVAEGDI
jgi:hypothetical protein